MDMKPVTVKLEKNTKVDKAKLYQCFKCNKIFINRKEIIKHLQMHNLEIYDCNQCDRKFKSKGSLNYHLKSHLKIKYKCEFCDRLFNDRCNMNKHRNIHLNIKKYKCNVCSKAYSDPSCFKYHVNRCNKVKFSCTVCSKKFNNTRSLRIHLKDHVVGRESRELQCDQCSYRCITKATLTAHKNREHFKKIFQCDLCSKIFYNKETIAAHWLKQHSLNKKKCHLCDAEFAQSISLQRHLNIHKGITFDCKICGGTYYSKETLQRHQNKVHRKVVPKTKLSYECNTCNKQLCDKNKLTEHINEHLNITFKCDICSKAFYSKGRYNAHRNRHFEKYECSLCFKPYKSQSGLKEHMEEFHSKLSYTCPYCKRTAKKKRSIDFHKRKMCQIKYECEICKRKFTQKKFLHAHVKSHFGTFHCSTCCTFYLSKEGLRTHMQEVHVENAYTCLLCNRTVKRRRAISFHKKQKCHIKFECPSCKEEYTMTRNSMHDHIKLCNKKVWQAQDKVMILNVKNESTEGSNK